MIVTRFPPSPTGYIHIGSIRTALFNYLFTKQQGGRMVFRIEDTDKERSKKEYEADIIEGLSWVGITYNEGPFRQSERTEIYKKYLAHLIEEGKAYVSQETPTEEGGRSEVIRFKNPNKKIKFTDLIRGEIEFDTTELGDFVIAKSLEEPLYHLAVVVDDFEMKVTHIIRGEDGISNTPRQILIQEAIGAPRPTYAHLPLVLAPDKSKLSKRKHGESVSLDYYRKKGYLPQAIINFLALLGWNPGTDQEIFTMEELISQFDLAKVQKGGAIFNIEKLNWINKEHLKKLPAESLLKDINERISKTYPASPEMIQKLLPVILDRINVFSDIDEMIAAGELDYFFNEPALVKEKLFWKGKEDAKVVTHLEAITESIGQIPEAQFTPEEIKKRIWPYAEKEGKGSVLWPVRYALSGKEKSPDPFSLIAILGKEKATARLKKAIHELS